MIYFDNAATSLPKPPCVFEAIERALRTNGNPFRGAHDFALEASKTLLTARKRVAALIGARPGRVAFTSGVTESLNIAIASLPKAARVVTTVYEHNSVLRPLYRLGAQLEILRPIGGEIAPGCFADAITADTAAVVCTHASNVTGELLDIGAIGAVCREKGALFIVDAAQTAGVFDIDMDRDNIDVLCFTGHKALFGPQGTGGICAREGVSLTPLKVGGGGANPFDTRQSESMPEALEAGTPNVHGIAGLSAGIAFIGQVGRETIKAREAALTRLFREEASRIEGVTLYGPPGRETAAVAALNVRDADAAIVSDMLAKDYGIATRPGAHCAPRMHEFLGTKERGAVRFSFSYFNTFEEIDAAIRALRELAAI